MAMASGSILQDRGKFGFIKQDGSEVDMFVMTPRDGPFAFALPPVGTRVVYDIVTDAKTGKPRAENLQPEAARMPPSSIYGEMAAPAAAIEQVLQANEMGGGSCAGSMLRNNGNFGFIKQDSGEEDMFVLPPSCQAFGGEFPPMGTRVVYDIVLDGKTGRPRATNVQPEGADGAVPQSPMAMEPPWRSSPVSTPRGEPVGFQAAGAAGTVLSGTMLKDSGNFGFISQDSGEEDMFVIPPSCVGFNGCLPAIGTRVLYEVVTDGKTGRPRAENIQPQVQPRHSPRPLADYPPQPSPRSQPAQGRVEAAAHDGASFEIRIGTMLKDNGNFGFIKQDNGEEDMFVMPPSCAAFGGGLPPVGSRLVYDVVVDSKTGRPRAENVRPESTAMSDALQQVFDEDALPPHVQAGMFVQNKGNFGFIRQDSGQEDMFVMPPSCEGFGGYLPPIGSRVNYEVVEDAKTGRPRAEKVHPERGSTAGAADSWAQPQLQNHPWTPQFPSQRASAAAAPPAPAAAVAPPGGVRAGTLMKNNGNFGFIQQDSGEEDMFVMPPSCAAFGGQLPPIGTRVTYGVVPDAKSGRPRAENVQPESHSGPAVIPYVPPSMAPAVIPYVPPSKAQHVQHAPARHAPVQHAPVQHAPAAIGMASYYTGTMHQINGQFGFIKQDSGEADMFVLPPSCHAFGNQLPPIGTRVAYEIVLDGKTGRPRAENVQAEQAAPAYSSQPSGGLRAGTIVKDNGKFGFIKQDSGEEDMFMLAIPGAPLPPLGTRVLYDVVIDGVTGRPRAENVLLEGDMHAQSHSMLSGTMFEHKASFGFIKQDSGEADMFVMPPTSGPFAGFLPPIGTRLVYDVVIDGKTGRPRAENVLPEPGHPAAGKGYGYGPAVSMGKGARGQPY